MLIGGADGNPFTVALMGAGDFFGEQALLNRAAVRGATIQAIEPTETLVVGRGEFEELRQQHPEVDRLLIGVLVAMVDRLTRQVAELTDVPGTVRIYRRIVALAELYADDAGAAAAPIEIPLTQDQLAGLAGVHLRLTSRVLGEARAAGLLDTSKRRLVVARPRGPAATGRARAVRAGRRPLSRPRGRRAAIRLDEPVGALGAEVDAVGGQHLLVVGDGVPVGDGQVAATSGRRGAACRRRPGCASGRSSRWTFTHTTGTSAPMVSSIVVTSSW